MFSSPQGLGRVGQACSSVIWVEAGDDLELGTVLEHDAAHHVDLPQLHEPVPFPATEVLPALAPTSEIDQPVALAAPVDARAQRNGTHPCPGELAVDAPRLRRQATLLVVGDPVVDALAAHQEPPGHLDHLPPLPQGSGGRWHPLTTSTTPSTCQNTSDTHTSAAPR